MFISISALTSYPVSNPNRGEDGAPKTAIYGGVARMRMSSQSQKRQWRMALAQDLSAGFSTRTTRIGVDIREKLMAAKWSDSDAEAAAGAIVAAFGKQKSGETAEAADVGESGKGKKGKKEKKVDLTSAEMVVLGHEEIQAIDALVKKLIEKKRQPNEEEILALPQKTHSVDVAMFGRMRAAQPGLNVDGAVSVAHALTVNKASIEDDLWTSVDDLNQYAGDAGGGAGGMGVTEMGAGVFYQYACIDLDQLTKNVNGDRDLAIKASRELIKAVATVPPSGYRAVTGTVVRAGYVRVDVSDTPHPNLVAAFEKPVNTMEEAVKAIRSYAENMNKAYGLKGKTSEMCVSEGVGTLAAVASVVT